MKNWESIVEFLELEPHPEGGWYRQVWTSPGIIDIAALPVHKGPRSFFSTIYFLITARNFSAFHRLVSDEIWYHHDGDPLDIVMIHPGGDLEIARIGSAAAGCSPQAAVPAGTWFASRIAAGGEWSLSGCAVTPGFEFSDFELANRSELTALFPAHSDLIRSLTR